MRWSILLLTSCLPAVGPTPSPEASPSPTPTDTEIPPVGPETDSEPAPTDSAPASLDPSGGVDLREVVFVVSWDRSGVVFDPDGSGWSVTTDQGFTLHLDRGWMITYGLWLTPCPTAAWSLPFLGTAQAAHPTLSDPSAVPRGRAERLHDPVDGAFDPVVFDLTRYCSAELLIARADHNVDLLADAPELDQISVDLGGTWDDGESSGSFDVTSTITNGLLRSLEDAYVGGTGERAVVELRYELGSLFDGSTPDVTPPAVLARDVLTNAVANVRVTARLEPVP